MLIILYTCMCLCCVLLSEIILLLYPGRKVVIMTDARALDLLMINLTLKVIIIINIIIIFI